MTDEQRKALTLYLGEPWTLSYNGKLSRTEGIGFSVLVI